MCRSEYLQSGGIDSTIISLSVAAAGRQAPLFTATFDRGSFDEVDAAREVAGTVGFDLHEVAVDSARGLADAFLMLAHHGDGQMADTGALAYFQLARAVRARTKVVLSGDGGDEFFCGYETYRASLAAERWGWVPARIWEGLGRLGYRLGQRNTERLPAVAVLSRFGLGMAAGGRHPHVEWRRLTPEFLQRRLYGPAMRDLAGDSPLVEYAGYYDEVRAAGGTVLDAAMEADQRFHLHSIIAKVDLMSMAHGLEVRVPLLDRRMMDLASTIDARAHYPVAGQRKNILRGVARLLGAPPSVTNRPKTGFNMPIAALLREDLKPVGQAMFESRADALAPYFLPDAVRSLWREHRDGRANHAFALWPLLVLGTFRAGMAVAVPASDICAPREEAAAPAADPQTGGAGTPVPI